MRRYYENEEFETEAGGISYLVSFTYQDELQIYPESFDGMTPETSDVTGQELTILKLSRDNSDGELIEVDIETCFHRDLIMRSCENDAVENVGLD